ncbi:MAG TPA: S9 family peptidase [Rhodocyclaceae bacterium]|nr:S9 family peptidase [Rhodocyclaceae bacterium]
MNFNLSVTAPAANQRPKRLTTHGHTRIDPFHWLRNTKNPATLDYLNAENAYADAVLAPTKALQEKLYQEMLGRIQEADLSVPVKYGEWMYYSRTEVGTQYAIHARRRIVASGWEDSPEEVLLDENAEAAGKAFYEVGDFEISPSGRYLAWAEDTHGFREFRLRIRDLHTGKNLRLTKRLAVSLVWAEDDVTLFYVSEDAQTKRANKLWRHHLHEKTDTCIYEERDARFNLMVSKTRSRRFLMLSSSSHTTSETRILDAHKPTGRWRIILRRKAGVEYDVDHHGDRLFMRINDTGPNFRLVDMPLADWRRVSWHECVMHRDDAILDDVDLYQDWLVLSERIDGLPQLTITAFASGDTHRVAFDDPAFVVDLDDLPEWHSPRLRYSYESLTTPDSLYEYDPATQRSTLLKRQPVLGEFDPSNYISERLHARAADGTEIPVSLVYRKNFMRDGEAPLWLEGYGGYGICNDPWFSTTRLSLLDRGWVFAIAHVRGGGELGQRWHDDGRLANKINSFTDHIACAEMLIARGYTSAKRILAQGGSAGGLLVGTVLNLRPELFGAAIMEVPFVDVVTTMLDESLPLTIGEYEEWGNPQRNADYCRLLSYSPYDNLAARPYPPILVEAGLHDSQVMIWEPAKYVAKLRTLTDCTATPLLLHTNMEAGHGGASGRYSALRERARSIAFAIAAITP